MSYKEILNDWLSSQGMYSNIMKLWQIELINSNEVDEICINYS